MAARDSKEYWADRAAKREKRASAKADVLAKKLKREYTRAAKEIRQKLDAFYGRYATERGLSYAETVKKLNSREAREWKKTLGEYVDEINAMPEGKAKDKLIAELDARSYASQQDRLSSLSGQIDMEVDRLFATSEEQMTLTMSDVLEDGYYSKAFDLQRRAGVLSPFARLSTKMVEDALTYPWSGADFSSRIWENKRALLFQARQSITQGLIQGKSVAAVSKDLADALGKSYTVAERLIRTETNHFHNEADKLAYTAAGVKEYEFMATLDDRTSEICGSLDGKHFPISEAKPGTNYPPMHPHCRSTTVEYDPEDAADWAASGEPMPRTMTYEEWKRQQEAQAEAKEVATAGNEQAESDIIKKIADKLEIPQNAVKLEGLPEDARKSIFASVAQSIDKYPQLKEHIKSVSHMEGMSATASSKSLTGQLFLSDKYKDMEQLEKAYAYGVKLKFYPQGTSASSILTHEIGHQLDGLLTIKGIYGGEVGQYGTIRTSLAVQKEVLSKLGLTDEKLRDIRKAYAAKGYTGKDLTHAVMFERKEFITNHISEYAATNEREFFAECYSEYMTSENPREAARIFGEILERLVDAL